MVLILRCDGLGADEREVDAAKYLEDESVGRGPGESIEGALIVDLISGHYLVSIFDPKTGLSSPAMEIDGGASTCVTLRPFVHDIVIRFRKLGI